MNDTDAYLALYRRVEDKVRLRFPSSVGASSPMAWLEDRIDDRGFSSSIRAAREVRNLLAHNSLFRNEGIVSPGPRLVSFLERLDSKLGKDERAEDVMTRKDRVVSFGESMTMDEMIKLALSSGHDHFPVLRDGIVMKVHSLRSLLALMAISSDECIEPVSCSRSAELSMVRDLLLSSPIVFVTEHGAKDEKMLGVITMKDVFSEMTEEVI